VFREWRDGSRPRSYVDPRQPHTRAMARLILNDVLRFKPARQIAAPPLFPPVETAFATVVGRKP